MKELFENIWNMPADQLVDKVFYTIMGVFLVFVFIVLVLHLLSNWQTRKIKSKDKHKIFPTKRG